jgi:hypothetical protein
MGSLVGIDPKLLDMIADIASDGVDKLADVGTNKLTNATNNI